MDTALEDVALNGAGSRPPVSSVEPSKTVAKAETADQAQFPASAGAQLVGQIVGLLTQSQAHRHLFLADLEWLIGPPLALRQFRIFHDDKKPVAVALWASVSDEVEKELIAGRGRLRPDEWKSGKNIWLIDLVAPSVPNSSKAAERLLQEISGKALKGQGFKMRILDPKTGRFNVLEFPAQTNPRAC